MKKKLLLSFAVFATALSVNAQKRFTVKGNLEDVKTQEFIVSPTNYIHNSIKEDSKRGVKVINDTLKLVDARNYYGSGNSGTGYTLRGVPYNADSTMFFTLIQKFNSKADIKVKGAGIVLQNTKKTDSVSVDVDFYGKSGKLMARVNKKIAVAPSLGIYYFNLPTDKYFNTDTLQIEVSGSGPNDTLKVLTTSRFGFGLKPTYTADVQADSIKISSYGTPAIYPAIGAFVTGAEFTPGTKIKGYNSKTGKFYLTLPSLTNNATASITVENLQYEDLNSSQGVWMVPNADPSKAVYFTQNIYVDANNNNKALNADVYIYPVVEYNYETDVKIDNKCLANNKTVNITLSNTEVIVKNPLFNRAAFDIVHRKLDKTKNYFYTYIGTSVGKEDNLLDGNAKWSYSKTYTADNVNDTINVNEYLITWNKVGYVNKTTNQFLISSKVTATNQVTKVPTATVAGTAVASATGGFAPYTYVWDDAAKTAKAELSATKGSYTATVTDANGCKSSTLAKLWLASISDLALENLSIYPNPVANELNVKFNANSAATIELVNVAGQVIATKNASEFANVTFDTAELNAGVYFVNIKVAEGTFTQKIIKE